MRITKLLSISLFALTLSSFSALAQTSTAVLIPVTSTEVVSGEVDLPKVTLPSSEWFLTDFFGGTAITTVGYDHGFPIRQESPVALSVRCLADTHELVQNLPGSHRLLPGQTLVVNHAKQFVCPTSQARFRN